MKKLKSAPSFRFLKGLDKDIQPNLLSQLKIIWTYTSNALEGNTLTLGETKFILEEGLTISGKTLKEHNEVVGHARVLEIFYDILEGGEINKAELFTLHETFQTEQIIDIYKPIGDWKKEINGTNIVVNDKVIYHEYSHTNHIEYLMDLWLSEFGIYNEI